MPHFCAPMTIKLGSAPGPERALSVGAAAASGKALVGVASGDAMVPAEDSIALGGYKQRSPFRAA